MGEALLIDLGNVLVRFDHDVTVRALEKEAGASPERLRSVLFGSRLGQEFDRGRLTPAEFFRAAEKDAGLPTLPDALWTGAWRDIFQPIPRSLALLGRLRGGLRTALVSNTNCLHWNGVLEICDVDRRVDVLALSFQVGMLKPEPGIWEEALKRLGSTPQGAVFADDRPDFVAAAAALGLDAFQANTPEALERGLDSRGLLIPLGATKAAPRPLLFERGLVLFREGRFFEAHEAWEELWKAAPPVEKPFLQGLIQVAAGGVHLGRGRTAPALRLFDLAIRKLRGFPEGHWGISLSRLERRLEEAPERLEAPESASELATYFNLE